MFRSSNPSLNEKTYREVGAVTSGEVMSVGGTVNKTIILFGLLALAAIYTWRSFYLNFNPENPAKAFEAVSKYMMLGLFGGLIAAFITIFAKTLSPVTAPIYAVLEGFFLGGLSAFMEKSYPGIVMQAVGLTFGVMFCMLMLYRSGIIKVTDKFIAGIVAATGAIFLLYLSTFVLGMFGIHIPYIHSSGPIGIGFSIVVIIIAAMNLVLDFYFIDEGAKRNLPKYMEWYTAFGLMVTLVWLYLEILRLLSKLKER